MNSISRVLETHGDEFRDELMEQVPASLRDRVTGVSLGNEVYRIETAWVTSDGERLPGPAIDIDSLAERFEDCEVGY